MGNPAGCQEKTAAITARSCQKLTSTDAQLSRKLESAMLNHEVLTSVADQLLSKNQVTVEDRATRVTRTGAQRLRTTRFVMGGREYQAIEQNPEKPSHWGKLARAGHKAVQFRDLGSQKYVAVMVDGQVREYSTNL
jgi:hypothetical protein